MNYKNLKLVTCALRFRGIYGPGELRTVQRIIVKKILKNLNCLIFKKICFFYK